MAHYEIEVWDKTGKATADIREFCSNLQWSKTLNGSETVSFEIDLVKFETLLGSIGYTADPFGFFEVGRNDIRIKRNGKYIVGSNVYRFTYRTDEPSIKLVVECVGYLNFYKTMYITADYTNQPQQNIMWDAINKCNQKTGGDYGVRQGTHTGAVVRRDRSYVRKEVASLITQMSNVINGCDFEFTPDKKFNTFEAKGVYRPSVRLTYPGNIQSFNFTRSVANVANYIYGLGSGNGEDVISATAGDSTSQAYLYRREKVAIWNSVTDQSTVTEHTNAVLHYGKDIIELPKLTLRDGALDLSEVDSGDTVYVSLDATYSLKHIEGYYRIQTIDCRVDDNDSETVNLSFDGLDIDEIIAKQQPET